MKVLLVSPYTMQYVKRVDRQPSLALLCLASALRQAGHEPVIIDLTTHVTASGADYESHHIQHVMTTIHACKPGMIGLNCLLSEHFPFVNKLSQSIKEIHTFIFSLFNI